MRPEELYDETRLVPNLDALVIPAQRAADPLPASVATAVNAVQPEHVVALLQGSSPSQA